MERKRKNIPVRIINTVLQKFKKKKMGCRAPKGMRGRSGKQEWWLSTAQLQ